MNGLDAHARVGLFFVVVTWSHNTAEMAVAHLE